MAELSPKQLLFADEYLIDLNATQAAIRAGYSPKTADVKGSQLLSIVKVRTYIDKRMAERSRRTGISQDRVLQELARIAFVQIPDLIDTETAQVLPNANKDDLAVIQGVKVKESYSEKGSSTEREIKVADKGRALEMLGRHLGMFNDKLDINANQKVVIVDDIDEPDDG
jgi:phage terminase small subunit